MIIHGIPAKAPGQLIVNTAVRHLLQCELQHFIQWGRIAAQARAVGHPQQQVKVGRVGEFGGAAESAMAGIKGLRQFVDGGCQRRRTGFRPVFRRLRHHLQCFLHGQVLAPDGLLLGPVIGGHTLQQAGKTGHAITRFRREIGAAEKRDLVFGGQEHGQRPAAGAVGEQLLCSLINLVEVRPFLAIHFYVDEVGIHHFGGGFILEGFMCHHVAPMAGGIADGQQNGFVLGARPGQRRFAPGIPLHRVAGMLQQVRAGFVDEGVGVWRIAHGFIGPSRFGNTIR